MIEIFKYTDKIKEILRKVDCLFRYFCVANIRILLISANPTQGDIIVFRGLSSNDSLTYQWQEFIGGAWVNIPSANSLQLTVTVLTYGTHTYRLVGSCPFVNSYSNTLVVEVIPIPCPPLGVAVFDNADLNIICSGGTTRFNMVGLYGDYSNPPIGALAPYQWQEFIGGVWTNIAGASGISISNGSWSTYGVDSYDTPALNTEGTYTYRVVLFQGQDCEVASDGETVEVRANPLVEISADELQICVCTEGETNEYGYVNNCYGTTLHAYLVTGGVDSQVYYQWQQLIDSVWTDIYTIGYEIPFQQGPDFNVGVSDITSGVFSTQGYYTFRCLMRQDGGCEGVTEPITVTVNEDPLIYLATDNDTICLSDGSTIITSEVVGGAGGNNYQWQLYDTINSQWIDMFSYNSDTITIVGTTLDGTAYKGIPGAFQFRVVVYQNTGCSGTVSPITITINNC